MKGDFVKRLNKTEIRGILYVSNNDEESEELTKTIRIVTPLYFPKFNPCSNLVIAYDYNSALKYKKTKKNNLIILDTPIHGDEGDLSDLLIDDTTCVVITTPFSYPSSDASCIKNHMIGETGSYKEIVKLFAGYGPFKNH